MIRELRRELGENTNSEYLEDGTFIVKNVRLLASGTWTDSTVKIPTLYSPKLLQEFGTEDAWAAKDIFDRHLGDSPRSVINQIGKVENIHYDEAEQAIRGDLHFHCLTQTSKDTVELIKGGQVNYVSVELMGNSVYNSKTQEYEMTSLKFRGLATVLRGACEVCKIELAVSDDTAAGEENMVEEIEELTEPQPDFMAMIDELKIKLDEIQARIDVIENTPAPQLAIKEEKNVKELSAAPIKSPLIRSFDGSLTIRR